MFKTLAVTLILCSNFEYEPEVEFEPGYWIRVSMSEYADAVTFEKTQQCWSTGTIDKDYPKTVGGYAFEMTEGAVRRIFGRINPNIGVIYKNACCKDSQDITDHDRSKITEIIDDSNRKRIVITHGTDTMIETAQYLNANLSGRDKFIVITGAQKPETFKNSDADFNVGFALGAAQCMGKPGVYIAMNASVYSYDNICRDKVSGQFLPKN